MKKLYIILGVLIIPFTSFGQKLSYQNEPIESIIIQSTLGKTKFLKGGFIFKGGQNYKNTKDEYIISFDDKSKKYKLKIYRRTKSKSRYRKGGEWTEIKETQIIRRNKNIDNELVSNLIDELSVKYRKTSFSKIDLSLDDFHKLTEKGKIEKVAKKNELTWKLKKHYSTEKMNETFFEKIRDTIQLNRFLNELSEKEDAFITTDAIDEIKIEIITTNNTYAFEGEDYYPYRQPWFLVDDNNNYKPVFNFEINTFLVELLPKNFLLISSIKESALINGYIKWALEEKEYIKN